MILPLSPQPEALRLYRNAIFLCNFLLLKEHIRQSKVNSNGRVTDCRLQNNAKRDHFPILNSCWSSHLNLELWVMLSKYYLEWSKGQLLLYTEATDFFMVHQIKIYILPNLLLQIFISCNLGSFIYLILQIEHYWKECTRRTNWYGWD
jgi:hypothetical protein